MLPINNSATKQAIPNNCQNTQQNAFQNRQMGMLNPQASNMQQQVQSQMGMLNPQIPMLLNNFNTPMFNGQGMPMLGNPQNGFMMQMSTNQPFNQFFVPMNNFPMFQKGGIPMQNMNQFVQRPMSNFNQASPCNVSGYPNQGLQVLGPQNANFNPTGQFNMVPTNVVIHPNGQNRPNLVNNAAQQAQGNTLAHPNLQFMGPQNPNFNPNAQFGKLPTNVVMLPNGQNQPSLVNNAAQPAQGNTMVQPNLQLTSPQQLQNGFRPPVSNTSQGNFGNVNGINSPQGKWQNNQNKNFAKNHKRDFSQQGLQKNQNKNRVKGYQGQAGQKPISAGFSNQSPIQQKKKLSLNYTVHEIQQWREERKKRYPSKTNIEKKQGGNMTESEELERIAKLRRQQLKDILEKQAKLGCEVAEIPSHYLYDTEEHANGEKENTKAFNRREKFQNNKFNKRGRSRHNDRFPKKQKFGENGSSNTHNQDKYTLLNKREPTFLQNILSADIRRDKARLLQVFRFMVMNLFFKDWPHTPLNFPDVVVKEAGTESWVVQQKPVLEKCLLEIKDNVKELNGVNDDDSGEENADDDGNDRINNRSSDVLDDKSDRPGRLISIVEEENEGKEEEGEILD